jgi:hypothetical protein
MNDWTRPRARSGDHCAGTQRTSRRHHRGSRLSALAALAGSERPGLILFRGGNYNEREFTERLAQALDLTPGEELPASLITIERWRIRKRRLPIKTR